MAHIPINHPLRPVYRLLAGLAGLYLFAVGLFGLLRSWGSPPFARDGVWVLGLRFNLASALLFTLLGAVIVAAALIGGQTEHLTNLASGGILLGIGFVALALLRFGNFLNFSMTNVIVSFVLGLLMMTAGMYDKVGATEESRTGRRGRPAVPPGVKTGRAG